MSNLKRILGVVGLAVAAAQPVSAQSWVFYNNCSTGQFRACASAEVTMQGSNLVMKVWNMNQSTSSNAYNLANGAVAEFGGWHTITAVGLKGLTYTLAPGGASSSAVHVVNGTTSTVLTKWGTDATANSIQVSDVGADADQGHKQGIVGCKDPGPTNAGHVATCGSYPSNPFVQFTFLGLQNINMTGAQFVFHGQQVGPNNAQSVKATASAVYIPPPPPPPPQVVPEPVTSILLGSGLAGLAAARRRKKKADAAALDA